MDSAQAVVPSERLLEQITSFESFRANAYICPGGAVTYGIGATIKADGSPVKMGDTITREEAAELLRRDVTQLMVEVRSAITWNAQEHIVDACVSLAYNIGMGAFRDSTCLRRLNAGDIAGAAAALQWFNKASDPQTGRKRVLNGLTARRRVEADLLLNGWDGTSSAVVTGATIAENRPAIVKSGGVWAQILTALGGLGGVAVLAAPQIMERGNSIADQVTAAQSMTDVMVAVGTILGGLAIGLYRKRQDFRSGDFGSQGR